MNKWMLDRLSEPSTYAGLAGIFVLIGLNSEEMKLLIEATAGIFAFIAIVTQEKKEEKK